VAASLAAIPVYLLVRSLRLTAWYAFACALYALLIPELVLVAYTSSDAVAYPLALGAVALGVAAVDTPTRRLQLGFLCLASLATVARVQYFVLVPAYLFSAFVVDRRDLWKRHRLALVAIGPAAVIFLVAVFGYYARER